MEKSFSLKKEISLIKISNAIAIPFQEYYISLKLPNLMKERLRISAGSHIFHLKFVHTTFSWSSKKSLKEIVAIEKLFESGLPISIKDILSTANPPDYNSYFTFLLKQLLATDIMVAMAFLEVSAYSLYTKIFEFKEIRMKKRSGGRFKEGTCLAICRGLLKLWREAWLIITNDGIMYLDSPMSKSAKESLLFDHNYSVSFGFRQTGKKNGLIVRTATRKLFFVVSSYFQLAEVLSEIQEKASKSPYIHLNRYNSFSPIRPPTAKCTALVNGKEYFESLYNSLMEAKDEVYIMGWWISPEFYLRRPWKEFPNSRLDVVLKSIADRGVKVHILIFWEVYFSLYKMYNDSAHTVEVLESLSINIKVHRFRGRKLFYWSQHEKCVIIDQKIGYLGGLDISFGRFDDENYNLEDKDGNIFPGMDYSNVRIAEFEKVREYEKSLLNRQTLPRMPWRDIGVRVEGQPVIDLVRHFSQKWNFVSLEYEGIKKGEILDLSIKPNKTKKKSWFKNLFKSKKHLDLQPYSADEEAFTKYIEMTKDEGKPIERETLENSSLKTEIDVVKEDLLSKAHQNVDHEPKIGKRKRISQFISKMAMSRWRSKKVDSFYQSKMLNFTFSKASNETLGSCKCQIVRSAARWSIGLHTLSFENSVQNAYIQLIQGARQFIYIENQYFISDFGAPYIVKNEIAEAIAYRIRDAYLNQQKFQVIIVIPLLPGYNGEPQIDAIFRVQVHWQWLTISKGENSLFERLRKWGINPEEYITFFGLRNHGLINGKPVTEMVYVHSKMMIIDDKIAIIGSANINDRSMIGTRDSEIAIIIEDNEQCVIKLDNVKFKAAKFAHDLRIKCWSQIFGFKSEELIDALDTTLLERIKGRAKKNTEIYKRVFGVYPDNKAKKYSDIKLLQEESNVKDYFSLKDGIKGFAVEFPHLFLEKEDLYFKIFDKEGLVSDFTFT